MRYLQQPGPKPAPKPQESSKKLGDYINIGGKK